MPQYTKMLSDKKFELIQLQHIKDQKEKTIKTPCKKKRCGACKK